MTHYEGLRRTVVLISRPAVQGGRSGETQTWLYDYPNDSWAHLDGADLPFAIGMNYNLEYDPHHRLLLLVATAPNGTLPAVWALNRQAAR